MNCAAPILNENGPPCAADCWGAGLGEGSAAAEGVVGLGSTVVVSDEDGPEQTWRIVSSHEADAREGRLSAESPLAVALLGRSAGERISVSLPKGSRALTILSVA